MTRGLSGYSRANKLSSWLSSSKFIHLVEIRIGHLSQRFHEHFSTLSSLVIVRFADEGLVEARAGKGTMSGSPALSVSLSVFVGLSFTRSLANT